MYLAPEGDELEIAGAAAEFLSGAMPIGRLHQDGNVADMAAPLRQALAEMGWFALALPEGDGGSGLSAVEHALFFREVGRQCGPIDVLAQSLAGLTAENADLRAALTSGECGVALAIADGAGLRLIGAPDARHALLATREGAELLVLDGTGAARSPLDPANSMRVLNGATPGVAARRAGDHVWQMGQLGVAAMLIGIAEAALALIVDYAKVRETFGRKIGSYQAVRHPCADMALRAEAARCQLWYAATAIKEDRSDAAVHLDAAKHLANQAAIANADTNIQLHGGIGVTDEHNAHLLLKHALLLGKLFGSKRPLLARLLNARAED